PECFEVEEALRERMKIPVFHDDQHGTAIIVAAAVINYVKLTGKNIESVRIVTSGAGAAAIACLNMLLAVGARREDIYVGDREGVVSKKRHNTVDRWRASYAQDTDETELAAFLA